MLRPMNVAGMCSPSDRLTPAALLRGETVAYTPVLRVGRSSEHAPVQARLRVEGELREVLVPEDQVGRFHEAARHGGVVDVRLMCVWRQAGDGELELERAEATDIDPAFRPWSGAALLREVAASPAVLTAHDFEQALQALRGEEAPCPPR